MPLTSSGAISMNDMRTEFGFGGNSISANQLYRGGTYVDATQTVNNAISSVTDSGFGGGGASQRFNFGNLANWSFANTSSQNYYGGRFPFQMGYLFNGSVASAALRSLSTANMGGSRATTPYQFNGVTVSNSYDPGSILYYAGTAAGGGYTTHTMNVTFAIAGTYYVYTHQTNNYPYDQYCYLTVSGANSGNVTNRNVYNYGLSNYAGSLNISGTTIGVSANQTVTLTMSQLASSIVHEMAISTSATVWNTRSMSVNSGVPGSGQISFNQLYGAT